MNEPEYAHFVGGSLHGQSEICRSRVNYRFNVAHRATGEEWYLVTEGRRPPLQPVKLYMLRGLEGEKKQTLTIEILAKLQRSDLALPTPGAVRNGNGKQALRLETGSA